MKFELIFKAVENKEDGIISGVGINNNCSIAKNNEIGTDTIDKIRKEFGSIIIDNIDFFEIKEDSIGEKQVKMNEDFEAGAIWGWNEARKRLEQNIK